jgi:hypothetical protein
MQSAAVTGAQLIGLAVAAETVNWVAERIWWIGSTLAVCFALVVAAASWLERWRRPLTSLVRTRPPRDPAEIDEAVA